MRFFISTLAISYSLILTAYASERDEFSPTPGAKAEATALCDRLLGKGAKVDLPKSVKHSLSLLDLLDGQSSHRQWEGGDFDSYHFHIGPGAEFRRQFFTWENSLVLSFLKLKVFAVLRFSPAQNAKDADDEMTHLTHPQSQRVGFADDDSLEIVLGATSYTETTARSLHEAAIKIVNYLLAHSSLYASLDPKATQLAAKNVRTFSGIHEVIRFVPAEGVSASQWQAFSSFVSQAVSNVSD